MGYSLNPLDLDKSSGSCQTVLTNGVRVMRRLLTTIAGFGAIFMLVACQGLQNLEPFLTPAADPTVAPTAELVQSDVLKAPSTDVPGPTTGTSGSKDEADQSRVTPSPPIK